MSDLVLDETNKSKSGTELVGETQDWGGNDYVFQLKTRLTPNGVTGIPGIGAVGAVGVEEKGIEECQSLSQIIVSGEALPSEVVRRYFEHFPKAKLIDRKSVV